MRKYLMLVWLAAVSAAGCGGDDKQLKPVPSLTAEEKAAVQAQDDSTDTDERGGSGTAAGKKKKGK